jgi:hypothetical protein
MGNRYLALTANFTPSAVASGRTEMGLPDMAALQLLWALMYCMCGCWKGTAVKICRDKKLTAVMCDPNIINVLLIHDYH